MKVMPPSDARSRIESGRGLVALESEGHGSETQLGDEEAGTTESNVVHSCKITEPGDGSSALGTVPWDRREPAPNATIRPHPVMSLPGRAPIGVKVMVQGHLLGSDRLAVLDLVGVGGQPHDGGGRDRRWRPGVMADETQCLSVDQLTLGFDVPGIQVVGPDPLLSEFHR